MNQEISVLGSTGSIGTQTLAVAADKGLKVGAITANRDVKKMEEQARRFHPSFVALYDEKAASELKIALSDTDIRIGSGIDGLVEAATLPRCTTVVTGVSGAVGLLPTLSAIREKKRIALANKETLVCAGEIVMKQAAEQGSEIIPVDSEHSAIFQCMAGRKKEELHKILLTGSGGPFRGRKRSELEKVTPQQAVSHPNWKMGAKISVDSATMMNKGLEYIEAMHLFRVSPEQIQVVVHPQSVIHSMVELVDGTVIAQLGVPDMGLPIQLALTWPERCPSMFGKLDFTCLKDLTFQAPDLDNTPCLALAMEMAGVGGTGPCIMSAANEVAVHAFLEGKLSFNRIYEMARNAVEAIPIVQHPSLQQILDADATAREFVKGRLS